MAHHALFKALSPLSWTADIVPLADDDPSSPALSSFVENTFSDAALLVDSIPSPTTPPPPTSTTTTTPATGRARAHTDSAIAPAAGPFTPPGGGVDDHSHRGKGKGKAKTKGTTGEDAAAADDAAQRSRRETVQKLRREWKEVKVPQQQNPHGISMYKMSAKDGKGGWFARRSLHRGGGRGAFVKWEAALRREMPATMEIVRETPGKEPGTGNIRGIGAEKRVDGRACDSGTIDCYHVSARFPGPTTPRDFVTLIIMPPEQDGGSKTGAPRQFMIVSRPCDHPACPARSSFIRGTYESVEMIREVPVEKPLRRVRSSIEVSRDELDGALRGDRMDRDALMRAARRAVEEETESEGEGRTVSFRPSGGADAGDTEMAIEWLMITRSDPGGSVPRFMVEKGTPGGIVNDAGKFLQWLSSQTLDDLRKPRASEVDGADEQETKPTGESPVGGTPGQLPAGTAAEDHLDDGESESPDGPPATNSGIYSMLTNALGMATSAVASRVAAFAPSSKATDSEMSDSDSDSDTSDATFASAEDGSASQPLNPLSATAAASNAKLDSASADDVSLNSTHSAVSETASHALSREETPSAGFSQARSQHEKELNKLQQRMRKAQEKLERAQARRRAKHSNSTNNHDGETPDAAAAREAEQALAKLRDRHARDLARQEEKYQRELQRLADKRAAEERKAEERRRKAAERETKANMAMELDRVRAERDVARKEVEMLRETVGELQGQNTMLVARLGKAGIDLSELENK